jgi:hypothetical protein
MNLFAEMFRSKVSSADPLSPGHDQRSPLESSILLYRKIVTQSRGRGEETAPYLIRGWGWVSQIFIQL